VREARRRHTIEGRDLAEIIIGSLVLAFPVAVTEEVWNLSSEISLLRAVLISLGSLVFISFFVRTTYFHETTFASSKEVAKRVLSVYLITLAVVAATLLVIGKLPLTGDFLVALKRTIIVAFPASFAATAVDSFHD
jgi:uncharacterized membrane protein